MRKHILAAVLVLMASGAQAVTLDVVGGQLNGASDVLVDGALYDVQFVDGTCISLYMGCDDISDFTFQTQLSAALAAQALLDQVIVDGGGGPFDALPYLTRGCAWRFPYNACYVMTPYTPLISPPEAPLLSFVVNFSRDAERIGLGPDRTSSYVPLQNPNFDALLGPFSLSSSGRPVVWAVWAPVPEPSTAALLGIGLAGLAARRRG